MMRTLRRLFARREGHLWTARVFLALTAIAGVTAAVYVHQLPARAHARATVDLGPACSVPPKPGRSQAAAGSAVAAFIRSAILRVETVCAWDAVGQEIRGDDPRREWADPDRIRVVPFVTRHRDRFVFGCDQDAPGPCFYLADGKQPNPATITLTVILRAPDAGEAAYQLALTFRAGRWQVVYGQPIVGTAGPRAA